ncbi:helix-turn-helix transcriptional regulator [Conexibacter sp. CPCC 206217]|uniref:helix-turn-helix transcriptional regulator n=1 Tax=Conexibacter sp. CPCC 206217 TaxID=3064574 RepID=UPI00272091F9|nr:helix-turn-helix transcriptional regulator [Conexibacter sp. CPCC 206217]MDO8213858.1 helix-turn-helix transcriptional regulator [Conexibacter sp. CPCC 206217]
MAPDLRRTNHSRALPAGFGRGPSDAVEAAGDTAADPRPADAAAPDPRRVGGAVPEPRLAAADSVRFAAFEAGLLGVAAATVYALTLVLLRASGAAAVFGAGCCALLLIALAVAARDPAVAFVTLQRRPIVVPALGAIAGLSLAALGPDNRLLFLPILLLLAALGMTASPRRALAASALATAGLLMPLLADPDAISDRRLLVLTAAGLLAIPPLLAALVARAGRATTRDEPVPPNTAGSMSSDDIEPVLFLADAPPRPAATDGSPLTPRQLEAVALTAAGLRHAEIAERLGVSIHQVRRLLRQGRERVDASTTRELVAWAMMRGIVGPETEARPSDD